MLRTFGSYERARDVYLEEFFSLDRMRDEAAEQFCTRRVFLSPPLALRGARRLLEMFFSRHVLDAHAVFFRVLEDMRRVGVETGAIGGGRVRRDPPSREEPLVDQARQTLGLDGAQLSAAVVKRAYRELMKRFHPDVNPGGLERTQEINGAYAVLLAALARSPAGTPGSA